MTTGTLSIDDEMGRRATPTESEIFTREPSGHA